MKDGGTEGVTDGGTDEQSGTVGGTDKGTDNLLPTRLANEESKSPGSIFPQCSGAPGLWIWGGGAGFSKSPEIKGCHSNIGGKKE